jgi:TolB protein
MSWEVVVPYRVSMADLGEFDDPGPLTPGPPSRVRRALTVAVLLTLVVSMVFLAWVSGRGEIRVVPVVPGTPTPQPAIAAAAPRLAVIDANGHLATTDAVGGSVVDRAAAGVTFTFPAWSPDGSHIAAIGQNADGIGVYVFATGADASAVVEPAVLYQSADRPPFYLYWAPDGQRVTFLTTEPDGLALRIAPADASAAAVPVRHGAPLYWTWVDGARILVHSGADGADAFFGEVGTDGTSVEPAAIEPGGFRAPAVTADGRYRAFVAPGDGASEQVVATARDGTSRYEVHVFGAAALDFSPTTDDLAFIAPDVLARPVTLPVGPLRLMAAGTGDVRTILPGSIIAFFWAPDGRTIAALQIGPPGDNVAGAGNAELAAVAAVPPGLALRLVFVDPASGAVRAQRAVRVTDAFVAQLIPYFDQYALSHRIWSSDSASIVLPVAADDGTSRLLVVPADGSDAREIAGTMAFWSPAIPR